LCTSFRFNKKQGGNEKNIYINDEKSEQDIFKKRKEKISWVESFSNDQIN